MTRIHVVNLPHTETTREYVWCAYTEKVRKFCNMLSDTGHEVILYAGEENEARCKEHVTVVTKEDRDFWFPDWNPETTVWDGWNTSAEWWRAMNDRTLMEIRRRRQPGDILGLIAGLAQAPLAGRCGMPAVEWGIGYEGVFADYRVFESYAWMHYLAGRYQDDNIRWYDAVIPNSFELEDYAPPNPNHDDYLLYLGRMTSRKGMNVVQAIADAGCRVITAGQGEERIEGTEHMGLVRGQVKAELLANAKAVLVPSIYLEPFGGVAVEAMMSGTPVIASDWAAFSETVVHSETGFRCRTLAEFLGAVDNVDDLDRQAIHKYAVDRYSTAEVALEYDAYFEQLDTVINDVGWAKPDGFLRDTVLNRHYR